MPKVSTSQSAWLFRPVSHGCHVEFSGHKFRAEKKKGYEVTLLASSTASRKSTTGKVHQVKWTAYKCGIIFKE